MGFFRLFKPRTNLAKNITYLHLRKVDGTLCELAHVDNATASYWFVEVGLCPERRIWDLERPWIRTKCTMQIGDLKDYKKICEARARDYYLITEEQWHENYYGKGRESIPVGHKVSEEIHSGRSNKRFKDGCCDEG